MTTHTAVFDRKWLLRLAAAHRDAYAAARPFPHAVLDDFLPAGVLDDVVREFPAPGELEWWTFDSDREKKLAAQDEASFGCATRALLRELNGAAFVDFLGVLTGIDGLVPDPHLFGGGLHQIEPGGFLKIHADFNRHPRTGLERRLNVLIYVNRDWQPEWGGALELWDAEMRSAQRRILPLFNRCVVFSTTDRSFHGHPEPLACPPGRTRRSLALYYYSKDRPAEEWSTATRNTVFRARPGDQFDDGRAGSGATARRSWRRRVGRLVPPAAADAARRARRGRA